MKKSLTFVIVMMCLIISTTCCWADNEQSQDESQGPIDIPYASVTDVYVGFTNLKGTAKCKAEIFLKAGSHVENAHITATIRKSSNNVVKTFSETVKATGLTIKWADTYKLPAKGKYYMHIVIKTYNSGKLLDEIAKDSELVVN